MGEIRLGTSGYSFDNWKGKVYPSSLKSSEMFDYYINTFGFNSVEINYTYYRPPVPKTFDFMVEHSPNNFRFVVKLFSGITHEPWRKSGTAEAEVEQCRQFIEGISPLTGSGKLGCLLAQFPPQMVPCEASWRYLHQLSEEFSRLPLVFEFRNKKWLLPETFAMLRETGVGFCAVDEPQAGPLMPLVAEVTSAIAYLRLHGRSDKWFSDKDLRYDYLYSEEELRSFLPDIRLMQERSESLYIQFNNCHAGSAVQNVKMMQYLLNMDTPAPQGVLF